MLAMLLLAFFWSVPQPATASVYLDAGPGGVVHAGVLYEYGTVRKTDEPFDGDAFLKASDALTGAPLYEYRYDGGNDETFIYLAILSDGIVALVTETRGIPGSGGSSLLKTEILTFSPEGERLDYRYVSGIMTAYNNHGGLLVLSANDTYAPDYVFDAELAETILPSTIRTEGTFTYAYRGFATVDGVPADEVRFDGPGIHDVVVTDGAYVYQFQAVVDAVVTGIADGGEYDGPVTIAATGTLTLDGESFSTGTAVEDPGNHVLAVAGVNGYLRTLAFVIHPYVANVASGLQTTEALRIFSNADQLLLDGIVYVQGAPFRIPGNHVLTVIAANGYEREIPFAILPSLQGVTDGGIYEEGVVVRVNGDAELDGATMSPETTVDEPGEHEIVLFFAGEPYATTHFTVVAKPPAEPWWKDYPFVEVGCGALALAGLFLIFRKK